MEKTSEEYEKMALARAGMFNSGEALVYATLAVAAAYKEGPSSSELSMSELVDVLFHRGESA